MCDIFYIAHLVLLYIVPDIYSYDENIKSRCTHCVPSGIMHIYQVKHSYLCYDDVMFQRSRLVYILSYVCTCMVSLLYICIIYTNLGAGGIYTYTHPGFSLPFMNS